MQCSYTWATSAPASAAAPPLRFSCCSFPRHLPCLGKYTADNVQRATCHVAFALAQTIFGLLLWPMRFVVFRTGLRPVLGNCVSARGTPSKKQQQKQEKNRRERKTGTAHNKEAPKVHRQHGRTGHGHSSDTAHFLFLSRCCSWQSCSAFVPHTRSSSVCRCRCVCLADLCVC